LAHVRVLSVASEVYPLIKTGGLADVVGALPAALADKGVDIRTLVPGYPAVLEKLERSEAVHQFADLFGGPAKLLAAEAAGLDLLVVDAPHLYGRAGNPYVDRSGRDWPDNAQRFAALARTAADIGRGALARYRPQIVHGHDWQAGLMPAYLHYGKGPRPGTVMTVHNLAFQGHFPAALLRSLSLPPQALAIDGVEYFGGIGFLKAGLQFADRITTVSPTYAAEIRTPEGGMALDGLLRLRSDVVSGILNGIDTTVWNPAADPNLAATYTAAQLGRRRRNKLALKERFGIRTPDKSLLFGVISRLSEQKGLDLLLAALPRLLALGADLVVLGSGDALLEQAFRAAATASSGRLGVFIGYDEALAHLVQGGSDALLVPSRFEPCGLTQLCALRYGSVPMVARVGGLNDTIVDANEMALSASVANGFQFSPVTREALELALARAAAVWREPKAWRQMQKNGMALDVSWDRPATQYARLYREVLAKKAKTMVGGTGIEPVTPRV
jgi:starch synthase